MRILIYSSNYFPELIGIGKYSGEMAEWLAERGMQVRVVTTPPYYPDWKVGCGYSGIKYSHESINQVEIWRCPLYVPKKPSGLTRLLHLASFAVSSFPVMVSQISWKPDVIFGIEPPFFCAPIARFCAWISGAKCWLHIQDFELDTAFQLKMLPGYIKNFSGWIERNVMQKFGWISTISGNMLDKLKEKGIGREKQEYFPNWVDIDQIFPVPDDRRLRKKLGISTGDILLLYSGNFGEKQGIDVVIESARMLIEEKKYRFVLCGNGSAYDRLRKQAENLANIHWLPLQPAEDMNALLNAADIHLLPQCAGTSTLVMPSKLGAMLASGKPVITNADGESETARLVSKAGRVVVTGDNQAFAQHIMLLGEDASLRSRLGRAGRKICEEKFSKAKILQEFQESLMQLVDIEEKVS